jgi:hypothetical protein
MSPNILIPFSKRWLILLVMTILVALVYVAILGNFIPKSQNYYKILVFGFLFSLFSQASLVRAGEVGHVMFFGTDTGLRCPPGLYFCPAVFVFTRHFDFVFGLAVMFTRVETANERHDVTIYMDQRQMNYRVQVNTDSLWKAELSRFISNVIIWFFDWKDDYGKFRFYKYGSLGYYCCFAIGLAAG